MISTEFLIGQDGDIVGFRISGHSGSEAKGNDIICAAVSSAAYMTANTITDVIKADAEVMEKDGLMLVRVSDKSVRDCRCIFAGFKLHMLGLEEQYPDNMIVSYMEV
jgi:hypothetical protein